MAARNAAAANANRCSGWASPPPLSRFGASSPPLANLHNRAVHINNNLEGIEEQGSEKNRHSPTPVDSTPTVVQSNLFNPPDPVLGGTSSAFEPTQDEIELHRKKYYVEGYTPLTDPKQGQLFAKYLAGEHGFTSITEVTPEFLTDLGFDSNELRRTIMRGLFFLLNNENKPNISLKYFTSFRSSTWNNSWIFMGTL
jgi:hypothetical protein